MIRPPRVLLRFARLFPPCAVLAAAACAAPHGHAPAAPAAQPAPHVESAESPYRALNGLPEGTILHVPSGVSLTPDQLFDLLGAARVVYVGESHDNLSHHRIQLDIIRALAERYPGQVAVGMEMFQRPAQPALDRWTRGELSAKEFESLWYENWTEDYAYYRAILEFVRDRRIPLIALNAAERTARALSGRQPDALSPEERAGLPEIDTQDPYHRRQMEAVFGGHAKGSGFDPFYRTMLLWDETMAQTVADFVSGPAGRDRRLVVLAGGGHIAYGFGIPRRAFRRAPVPYVTVIPQTEVEMAPADRPDLVMQVESFSVPLPIADIVWAVGYEDLPSPSVRLGVRIEAAEGGVTITSVDSGSAAERAGLREDDVIVSFDGETVRRPADVVRLVRGHGPGDHASLTVTRGAETMTLDVSWPK
ncbi:MAG TPA: ChaN family lipoprotein [Nitrospiria bacterium]|nr:ChaN family lipoprotein [Nitrospiria bacterium]